MHTKHTLNKKILLVGLILVLILSALALGNQNINMGGSFQSATMNRALNPPKMAVQQATRLPTGEVMLQYTYTAPNACWIKGDNTLSLSEQKAQFEIVPRITEGICAQSLTPLTYDQALKIPKEIEVLFVVVTHPQSGILEKNELLILNP